MKYFVENLPENCMYCDCCHTKPYDNRHKIDGEKFCGILNEDVEVYYYHGDGRPEFCPLRELPKKKREIYQLNRRYSSGEFETYGVSVDNLAIGYNQCIDDILNDE